MVFIMLVKSYASSSGQGIEKYIICVNKRRGKHDEERTRGDEVI